MTIEEISKLLKQIKTILPTIQIPETDKKTKEEIKDILTPYIISFGELNYTKTLLVIKSLIENETKFETFKTYPIPTIVQEYKRQNKRDIYKQRFIQQIKEKKEAISEKAQITKVRS